MKNNIKPLKNFSILIIKIGALGDVVRTTFLLKGLHRKYPNCKIQWYTSDSAKELLQNNPLIEKIITHSELLSKPSLLTNDFDLVLSFDEEIEAAKLASAVSTKKLIGVYFNNQTEKVVYTTDSSAWLGMGLIRPAELGGKAKADILKKKNKKTFYKLMANISQIPYDKTDTPIINLTDEELKFSASFLNQNSLSTSRPIIGLNTGAGGRWVAKRWSKENTAKLANLLISNLDAQIILLGGPEEKERNLEILKIVESQNPTGLKNIVDAKTNNSLREFAAIINLCDAVVTSDTMALHISVALKKKVIALIATTSISEIDVFGNGAKLYPKGKLCFYNKECNHTPACMDKITVDEVYNSILSLLKTSKTNNLKTKPLIKKDTMENSKKSSKSSLEKSSEITSVVKKDFKHSLKAADLEFKEEPMDGNYENSVVGLASRGRVKVMFKDMKKYGFKGKKVLDVGCEAGYVSLELQKRGAEVYSFDIIHSALVTFNKKIQKNKAQKNKASSKSQKESIGPNPKLFLAAAQQMPLKSNSFDYVICTEVLEHMPHREIGIKEMHRVVKKGGLVFLTFPNEKLRKPLYPIARLFGVNTSVEDEVTLFDYEFEKIEQICKEHFKIEKKYSWPFFYPITRFIVCRKR